MTAPLRDEWNWEDWEPGDTCVWEDDSEDEGPFILTHVDHQWDRSFWTSKDGEDCMTRSSNLIRVLKQGQTLSWRDLSIGDPVRWRLEKEAEQ